MSRRQHHASDNQIDQLKYDNKSEEKEIIPTNNFQKFFKLEIDSLDSFAYNEISNLKEEFASRLLTSISYFKKYENLRRLCDKKLDYDQYKHWKDRNNSKTSRDSRNSEFLIDSRHSRDSNSTHKSSHSSFHDDYYYDKQYRSRKLPPPNNERRHNPNMTRQLPSSQRKNRIIRSYQDDIKRVDKFKSHISRSIQNNQPKNH